MKKVLFGLLLTAALCNAAEVTLNLNPAQTHFAWTLGAIGHTVHGTFLLKRMVIPGCRYTACSASTARNTN